MRVPATGGAFEQITTVDTARGETDHVWPHMLPEANGLIFTVIRNNNLTDADIAVLDISRGETSDPDPWCGRQVRAFGPPAIRLQRGDALRRSF